MDKIKMKLGFRKSVSRLTYFLVFSFMYVFTGQFNIVSGQAPAPLFEDPVYHAVRDPTVVYNYGTGEWWMFYTQGRPANPLYDLNIPWSWLWNCDIGIAKTANGGASWTYMGTVQGLNASLDTSLNTHWAPEIIYDNGTYHMFVFLMASTHAKGAGNRHYTSTDLKNWTLVTSGNMPSGYDPCVAKLPNGTWRMWTTDNTNTYAWDSSDLNNWTSQGQQTTVNYGGEGSNVFVWNGYYWLILDTLMSGHPGFTIWRSSDGSNNWINTGTIMGKGGLRPHDTNTAAHGDVVVSGSNAYIFYFNTDDRDTNGRQSVAQVARLIFKNRAISCNRNATFELNLGSPAPNQKGAL